eukprot:4709212-Amphidinium_carterae.1
MPCTEPGETSYWWYARLCGCSADRAEPRNLGAASPLALKQLALTHLEERATLHDGLPGRGEAERLKNVSPNQQSPSYSL